MPSGVPVATVALNGSVNAALLAVQILATSHPALAEQLVNYKKELKSKVIGKVKGLQDKFPNQFDAAD
jgi:5-(carboxyamino)imidazole ribonucleotide mutase